MDIDRIRRVKDVAQDELLKIPGVRGVSIGYKYVGGKATGTLCIRVLVEKKQNEVSGKYRIPKTIHGVPTDVVERRYVPRPLSVPLKDLQPLVDNGRYNPLIGGISAGPCREIDGNVFVGTLGLIVTDNVSAAPMVLSNFHVLALDNNFMVGDTIVQPSLPDGGNCPADVVAVLERAMLGGQVDAAAARITARDDACRIADIGDVDGIAEAELGMIVRKRGRTTELTQGVVDGIDLTVVVPYDGIGDVTFNNQIEIRAGSSSLDVEPGLFLPTEWTNLALTEVDGITIERDISGPNPGITVTGPTGSLFHATIGSNTSRYMVFGSDNYVLILDSTTLPGPVTHRVSVTNLSTMPPGEKLVLTGLASSSAVQNPVVQHSQGNGAVFMIYSSSGTQIQNLVMVRSRDGEILCGGPPPFVPTGETRGEAETPTKLVFHYSSGGTSKVKVCDLLPEGTSDVFGLGGDSGSVVVDEQNRVVGLFFASNAEVTDNDGNVIEAEGTIGNANPIGAVLEALSVSVCEKSGGGGVVVLPPPGPRSFRVKRLAVRCLDKTPPIVVRRDIFEDADQTQPLRLFRRLVEIDRNC